MLNLNQHGVAPCDLLRRRLEAVTGRAVDGLGDRALLDTPRRTIVFGADLHAEGAPRAEAWLVVGGVAGQVRLLPDGRRQILNLRLPGDIVQNDGQDSLVALTPVDLVDALPVVRELTEGPPQSSLRRAWVAALRAEHARLNDQVVRLGRLSAYERLAHLLLETHERLFHVGLASANAFHLPLRQEMIADLLGLSVVHVSRTTQQLRRDRLAATRSNYVTLQDRDRLADIACYVSRFAARPASNRFERPAGVRAAG